MNGNSGSPDLVRWPPKVFSVETEQISTVLSRPFAKAGGKPLILFGDIQDMCELDTKYSGENARRLQYEALLEKAKSINAQDWIEGRLTKWGPDGGRFDGWIAWWRCEDWQEVLRSRLDEYGEREGPNCDQLENLFFYPEERLNYWLVPVEQAWMIPSYLNCPIWNDDIEAAEMSALFRRWERKYGAEFCLIDQNGSYGFRVARPPQTMEAALLLAREHAGFCDYCLDERISDPNLALVNLAQDLMGSRSWHFWFD